MLKHIPQKYIVTIATFRDMDETAFAQPCDDAGDSIPDAWIFDREQGYCFLIEAKVGDNPLGEKQVIIHAKRWLDITVKDHLIALTWIDVLNVIKTINTQAVNSQESLILQEFNQYLGFFGYRLFAGFEFSSMPDVPNFYLSHQSVSDSTTFMDFSRLHETPVFRFGSTAS